MNCRYEIEPLHDGWKLTLFDDDGQEVGGGFFEQDGYDDAVEQGRLFIDEPQL